MKKLIGKKWRKRVLSVVLALGMVLSMLPVAMNNSMAAGSDLKKYSFASTKAVRGVVDSYTDLPQYQYTLKKGDDPKTDYTWKSLPRGTADRPFVILELVPSHEFAEIGYLIEGCEPIKMEDLHTSLFVSDVDAFLGRYFYFKQSANNADVNSDSAAYFFLDEKEASPEYYSDRGTSVTSLAQKKDPVKFSGYYERVEDGKGNFVFNDAAGKIEKNPNGNIVWHTLNKWECDHNTYEFADPLTIESKYFQKVGDKYYTYRQGGEADPYVDAGSYYYFFKNRDPFVTDVIGMTAEAAPTYSVVVKTITPDELNIDLKNNGFSWVDYADLIYINPKSHNENYAKKWKSQIGTDGIDPVYANRLNEKPSNDSVSNGFKSDISFNNLKRIFERACAEEDYIGLVFDYTMKDFIKKEKTSPYILDYNFNKTYYYSNIRVSPSERGAVDNLGKLWVMCFAQNMNVTKKMFWDTGRIYEKDDKAYMKGQPEPCDSVWSEGNFLLIDPDTPTETNTYALLTSDMYWSNWNATTNINDNDYAFGHVYGYNGNNSLTQSFTTGKAGINGKRFDEFNDYVLNDPGVRSVWESHNPGVGFEAAMNAKDESGNLGTAAGNIAPSAALRYILGLGTAPSASFNGTLKVLDVEPSVKVTTTYGQDWHLDEKKNRINMMLPDFTGNIEFTSMTMGSFVGRTEDLSGYDLIYFGADIDGFWTDGSGKTDFVDPNLDGRIYSHVGDLLVGGKSGRVGDFVSDGVSGQAYNIFNGVDANQKTNWLRFPGNDITKLKNGELVSYMTGGHPVVANLNLLNASKMDQASYIYKLVTGAADALPEGVTWGSNRVFKATDSADIQKAVLNSRIDVKFDSCPVSYNDENKVYLEPSGDYSVLPFVVTVDDCSKYGYRLYIDKNRNAKFEKGGADDSKSELVKSGTFSSNTQSISYLITKEMVGFVQWRIEVYRLDNEKLMRSKEGCSAIKFSGDPSTKTQIHVLQIVPDDETTLNADLKNSVYASKYQSLDAFEITVDQIKYKDFKDSFKDCGFSFDMGAAISEDNPSSAALAAVDAKFEAATSFDALKTGGVGEKMGHPLSYYNMIIVGFADSYGKTDLSDDYGAAEYLYYFAMNNQGSILFTHDNTSLYNNAGATGYTANTMMRDLMGMNRYGVTSKNADSVRSGLAEDLRNYRNNLKTPYDSPVTFFGGGEVKVSQSQGFTINALHKMTSVSDAEQQAYNFRFPYKYMVKDAADESKSLFTDAASGFMTAENGSDEAVCQTTRIKRLNQGQITEYPYNISEVPNIAPTHAQWYQLNMEDPEVTVWYTLEYDGKNTDSDDKEAKAAKVYSALPQDAANNYYIYSKGNVFYSGVGHSNTDSSTEEIELFVNTMIAAYRPGAEPPTVEVTNEDAVLESANKYKIRIPRELNVDGDGNSSEGSVLGDAEMKIYFRPIDFSLAENISVQLRYVDKDGNYGSYITTIYKKGTNAVMSADGTDGNYISKLDNGQEYYFIYDTSLIDSTPTVEIEAKNEKVNGTRKATVTIATQPLFKLD